MERIGEYIREFAGLLGAENSPVFKGVKKASTGLRAFVPEDRVQYSRARMAEARLNPEGKAGRYCRKLESMLAEDAIAETQILDEAGNVLHALFGARAIADDKANRLTQEATVDGVVTGLVGADDTMHLHLRDHFDRDLRLVVRDEALARAILSRFRDGAVRLRVRGSWVRTDQGWAPEVNRCTVLGYQVLEDVPVGAVFADLAAVEDNGWRETADPMSLWETIRGLH
ncbi:hypothetical protein SAMN05444680_10518 [Variovorax sp. YR216]|nr:hypothetical protein SAMN05444680_10518 [Variovorax sp. YR216]